MRPQRLGVRGGRYAGCKDSYQALPMCPAGQISTEPGSCGDITFYLAEVRFQDLEDPEERSYLNKLPTSFRLKPKEVDKLRDAARRLLRKSEDFQRLLRDLEK